MKGETCVSLYLRTSPLGTDAQFNRTAFKDIAKEALSQLRQAGVDKGKIDLFEEQFDRFAGAEHNVQDEDRSESCSVLSQTRSSRSGITRRTAWRCCTAPGMMRTFRLPDPAQGVGGSGGPVSSDTPYPGHVISPTIYSCWRWRKKASGWSTRSSIFHQERLQVPDLPGSAEEATRRPSFHVRAPRRRLQNLEGEKVLLQRVCQEGRAGDTWRSRRIE